MATDHNALGLSRSSFHRIAKLDIRFHPCVMITRQELRDSDPVQRMAFCNQLVNTVEQKLQFLGQFIVSDEAVFSFNLEVNTRNVIKYSAYGNGHPAGHYVELAQGTDQVMVWVGLTRAGVVLGPHFAERNLATSEYIRIIRYHVIQRDFHIFNTDKNNMWWQQDGAPAHASHAKMQYLRGQFPLRLMSKRGDWPWPPRSPD